MLKLTTVLMLTRIRNLFRSQLLAAVIILFFSTLTFAANAKNIVLMIGDGMGPAHIYVAWLYSTRQLSRDFAMTEIMNKGRTAYMYNDGLDGTVTESAEAATQMATGVEVHVKAIGVGPDGRILKTILELARDKGKATGLVTTSGITDATPAAFAAHVDNRSKEDVIAQQLLNSGVNILFGGNKLFFLPETEKGRRKDGRNLVSEAKKSGYVVVETAEQMKNASGARILGLFSDDNMLFEIDRKGSREPSLAEMTSKALEVLEKSNDGFFLMVEGGRIDHAAHHNDSITTITDTIAFDEAVKVAYEFQKKNPDTLLIITADHETGALAILPDSPTALRTRHRIAWGDKSHSGAPLFLWGIGPGSELINGWKHNTELFGIMKDAYGF